MMLMIRVYIHITKFSFLKVQYVRNYFAKLIVLAVFIVIRMFYWSILKYNVCITSHLVTYIMTL